MTGNVMWERDSRVLWRRTGTTALLKHPEVDEIHQLDQAGLALWSELGGPTTLAEVAGRLGVRFGVDPTQIAEDIGPVLTELTDLQLVRRTQA